MKTDPGESTPTVTLRSPRVLTIVSDLLCAEAAGWLTSEGTLAFTRKERHDRRVDMVMFSE